MPDFARMDRYVWRSVSCILPRNVHSLMQVVHPAQNTEIPRDLTVNTGAQACENPRVYLEFNAVRSGGNASRH